MSVRRLLSRRHRARYRSLSLSLFLSLSRSLFLSLCSPFSAFLCLPLSLPPFLASNACWKSMIPPRYPPVAAQRSLFRPSRSARNETAARVASITRSRVLRGSRAMFHLFSPSTFRPFLSLRSQFLLSALLILFFLPFPFRHEKRSFFVCARACICALEGERKNVLSSKLAAESFTELSEFSAAIFCQSGWYVRDGHV